jgi:hypothetical protein
LWYSQKFNGPGIKYEVLVCIKTGFIVWINGPFPASFNDSTIFIREGLAAALADDEGVECDGGYKGHPKLKSKSVNKSRLERQQKSAVRSRHEIVNSRLKIYNVLNIPFHHLKPRDQFLMKHGWCFHAIAVVTQLKFEANETIYDVDYNVEYF